MTTTTGRHWNNDGNAVRDLDQVFRMRLHQAVNPQKQLLADIAVLGKVAKDGAAVISVFESTSQSATHSG